MKKVLLLVGAMAMLFQASFAQRVCGTQEAFEYQKANDSKFELRRQEIENFTNDFIQQGGGLDRALVTIPVVVHVVWNTTAENISDAQIQSQIDVLNADFRKLNADVANVPAAFASLAGDANIEFCLATIDPNGNPTTGITRTQTSVTAFGTNDQVKSSSTGGVNAWSRDQYLNIWVCDISGGILGYAQFPGGAASTDGVVCDFQYFGTIGTATAPFNKGRTATHEVGHWLNLFHIWGDDGTGCTGSDQVSDTPNAGGPNYGCPVFPKVSCTNGPNGDMFMNYMDYSDDACMYMFSNGQISRMQALFATGGFRAALLNSTACGPVGSICATPTGLTSGSLTASSATATWAAVNGAQSYNLRWRPTSTTTWTNVTGLTATTFAFSALNTCTSYEWQVQTVCSATSSGNFSASSTFTTTGCVPTYCASAGQSTVDEWINNVSLNTLSNTSGNNNGYANFSATLGTTLATNTSYTFTGTPGYTGTAFSEFWRVWIDYNGDLDFLDAGEQVFGNTTGSTTAVSGSFTVPSTAVLGTTRMRVAMKYNAAPTACETFQYGEVEDYFITIVQGVSCNVPTGLAASAITTTGATLNWTAVSGAVSYTVEYKLNTATVWTAANATTNSLVLTGLTAGTAYNARVRTNCSAGTSAFSAAINFTTTAATACSDIYETNNTSSQAKSISVNTNITARIGTATDRDWFRFSNTTSNRNIRIDMTNLPADYDVRLLNPSNVQVGISQNSGTANEAIIFNNGPVGTYRVEVYGFQGAFNSTLCYTLRASRSGTAFREGQEVADEEFEIEVEVLPNFEKLNAFPNPTEGNVDLTFVSGAEAQVGMIVIDAMGREVHNTKFTTIEGVNIVTLDMMNYASGYYTVVLFHGENKASTRIMKQ